MHRQYEQDWDKRYVDNDTPWEEEGPSLELGPLLKKYTKKGQSLLEIGCGLGTNAKWFVENGYRVDVTDISESCIKQAQDCVLEENGKLNFYTFNILTWV